MSKKEIAKHVNIKMTDTAKNKAKELSLIDLGRENISGYYTFLINKRDKEINNT